MPDRPPNLDTFARHVLADTAPAVCIIDRDLMRALLAYVRALEREREEPGDWRRMVL